MGRAMTPESVVGLLHLADHWKLMLHHLLGQPLPPLPDAPGRIFKAPIPTDSDPLAEAWDALEARTGTADAARAEP